jgi:hypothetical protein
VIQEALCWDLNDSPATLLERGKVDQNEEGHNIDIPDWDEHVDSLVNKGWVDQMTVIVAGCIEVSISSAM